MRGKNEIYSQMKLIFR